MGGGLVGWGWGWGAGSSAMTHCKRVSVAIRLGTSVTGSTQTIDPSPLSLQEG